MGDIKKYRDCIENIIRKHGKYKPSYGDIERQLVFDRERDHYQLWSVGWNKHERVYGCVLHFDIKDGKIWIQYNGTEGDVANDLVALGVPKEDIVLGFHAPYKRPYTGFSSAIAR